MVHLNFYEKRGGGREIQNQSMSRGKNTSHFVMTKLSLLALLLIITTQPDNIEAINLHESILTNQT